MSELADNPAEVWDRALELLKGQMTRATFDFWLARTWVIEVSPGAEDRPRDWVIGVTNARALDWLSHRLAPMIARTLSWAAGEPASVRFVVASPDLHLPHPLPPSPNLPATCPQDRPCPQDRRQAGDGSGEGGDGDDPEDAPALDTSPAGEGADLVWTDFYIKLKVAFRKRALAELKGARLSVFLCLALHVDRDGIAKPGGIEAIMHETGYSRGAVCSALEELTSAGLIRRLRQHRGADQYRVLGYAWFGQEPAPALWESEYEK